MKDAEWTETVELLCILTDKQRVQSLEDDSSLQSAHGKKRNLSEVFRRSGRIAKSPAVKVSTIIRKALN